MLPWHRVHWSLLLLLTFVLVAPLTGCTWQPAPEATATATSLLDAEAQIWSRLERQPLTLTSLTPGTPCPSHPGLAIGPFGPALGEDPVYVLGGADGTLGADEVLRYLPPSHFHSVEWGGTTTFFVVAPGDRWYVLVRGRRLDGPNEVLFGDWSVPTQTAGRERVQTAPPDPERSSESWTSHPAFTRVRAPGCYAYQLDGLRPRDGMNFTHTIVFSASAFST